MSVKIEFLIKSSEKDGYWDGGKSFVSLWKLGKNYATYPEAETVITNELPPGTYLIKKVYRKTQEDESK